MRQRVSDSRARLMSARGRAKIKIRITIKIKNRRLRRDIDVLQFGVALQRGHSQIASNPALFETAKGCFKMDAGMGVDAQNAALDRSRDAERALKVIGPNRAAQ